MEKRKSFRLAGSIVLVVGAGALIFGFQNCGSGFAPSQTSLGLASKVSTLQSSESAESALSAAHAKVEAAARLLVNPPSPSGLAEAIQLLNQAMDILVAIDQESLTPDLRERVVAEMATVKQMLASLDSSGGIHSDGQGAAVPTKDPYAPSDPPPPMPSQSGPSKL